MKLTRSSWSTWSGDLDARCRRTINDLLGRVESDAACRHLSTLLPVQVFVRREILLHLDQMIEVSFICGATPWCLVHWICMLSASKTQYE